jgi:F0F1-type ATP synthase assembly protein I
VLRHAYKTAIERFIWTIFLLLIGFKLLDLSPLWLLAGFVMGQAVWLLAPIWMKLRTQNDK